jgi:hypothetical protein
VPPEPLPFETLHGGSAIRFLGISKDRDFDTSSLQTLEFGGDCWIFYGPGPFIE